MDTQPSRLTISDDGNRSLTLGGVIDSHTKGQLSDRLSALGTSDDVMLDLRNVEFIDSSGLRTLLLAHQDLDGAASKLQLSGISEAVDRLFEITGLREHLNITE